MPHYRATPESHASLAGDGLLLIDSGAQYRGGTTDITRMWPVGSISAAQRRDVTLVLRGTIALSRARFPRGTLSPMLDTIARVPLWEHGLDYGHGTGHGVGYFLNVHEGPQSFSRVIPDATMAMQPGMITSVEPGLYRPGQWGVRVENLVLSVPATGLVERVRRVPRVRDAHPLPDRCPLPRALAAARRRDRLAECVPRHGSRAPGTARLRRCARLADAAHRAARLGFFAASSPPDGPPARLARGVRRASAQFVRPRPGFVASRFRRGAAVPRVRSIASPRVSFKEPTMISRLTFCAAVFAAVATVSLAYAADSAQQPQAVETPRAAASAPAAIVVMPTVEVTGRRIR